MPTKSFISKATCCYFTKIVVTFKIDNSILIPINISLFFFIDFYSYEWPRSALVSVVCW
jgi:hypothetical protein